MRATLWGVCMLALAGAAHAQETATYTYDVHGRLVGVSRSTGATTAYTYDDGDSRTSRVTTGASSLLSETQPFEDSEAAPGPSGEASGEQEPSPENE